MSDSTTLAQAVNFGAEVSLFLSSPVGTYLLEKAKTEEAEALEALATVDAYDTQAIQSLQAQAYRANSFVGWLQEALENAHEAHRQLDEQEHLPPSIT
jgi:hypothetical protein